MKKVLLALLVGAGIISTAQAQSSVTVYGLLDVGYIGSNYKGVGGQLTQKQTTSAFGNNGESPSRLGFKGSEDLGGGTSAVFTIETGINAANATASTFNNRQSFVGLKQAGYGQAAFGTQYTPVFTALAASDVGQTNDQVGSAIYGNNPQANGNAGSPPYAGTGGSGNTSDSVTIRTSNAFTLQSDRIEGFQAQALVTANNSNATQTSASAGGTTNYNGWGLNGSYVYDKLYATVAYQSLKSVVPGTLTSPVPSMWTTAGGGVNTQDNQTYVAATYDFGILKGYAQWINRKVTDTINTGYWGQRQAQQLGVRGYITPAIEGWASVGTGKVKAFGNTQPTANFVAYQVGSNYYLSKRTNLYAIYGQNNVSSASTNPSLAANSYALGVRHTF